MLNDQSEKNEKKKNQKTNGISHKIINDFNKKSLEVNFKIKIFRVITQFSFLHKSLHEIKIFDASNSMKTAQFNRPLLIMLYYFSTILDNFPNSFGGDQRTQSI